METFAKLLAGGTQQLSAVSPSAQLDATLLLCAAAGCSKTDLISCSKDPVTPEIARRFRALIVRRSHAEPVAYLTGEKEFWGLGFGVTHEVLIPRPETELLVERAVSYLDGNKGATFLDMGTGSGCIAVAIAHELHSRGNVVHGVALDVSNSALQIARANAARHAVLPQLKFLKSDWFKQLDSTIAFDLIVSNPPYIAEGDAEVSPETRFEPHGALYSGTMGLDALREILCTAFAFLRSGGVVMAEIGSKQQSEIEELYRTKLAGSYSSISFLSDLAGHPRVVRLGV